MSTVWTATSMVTWDYTTHFHLSKIWQSCKNPWRKRVGRIDSGRLPVGSGKPAGRQMFFILYPGCYRILYMQQFRFYFSFFLPIISCSTLQHRDYIIVSPWHHRHSLINILIQITSRWSRGKLAVKPLLSSSVRQFGLSFPISSRTVDKRQTQQKHFVLSTDTEQH